MDTVVMGDCYVCSKRCKHGNMRHRKLVGLLKTFASYLDQSTFTFHLGSETTRIFLCKQCFKSVIKLKKLGKQKAVINKEIADSTAAISQGILNRRNQNINGSANLEPQSSVISSSLSPDSSTLDTLSAPTEYDTVSVKQEEVVTTEQNNLTNKSKATIQNPIESIVTVKVEETNQDELTSAIKDDPGSLDTKPNLTFSLSKVKVEETNQDELTSASKDDPGSLDTTPDLTFSLSMVKEEVETTEQNNLISESKATVQKPIESTVTVKEVETKQNELSGASKAAVKLDDPGSVDTPSDLAVSQSEDKADKSKQDGETTASHVLKIEIKDEVMENTILTRPKDLVVPDTDLYCYENCTSPGDGDKSESFEKNVGHEAIRQFLQNELPEASILNSIHNQVNRELFAKAVKQKVLDLDASKVRTGNLGLNDGVHETIHVKDIPRKPSFVRSSSWKADDLKIHEIKASSNKTDIVDSGRKRKSSINEDSFLKKNMTMINVNEPIDLPIPNDDAGQLKTAQLNTNPSPQKVTEPKPFKCSICENDFKTRGALQQHKRVHTEEKPYNCLFCEKSFRSKNDLAGHKRIHAEEKPYSCSFCTKSCRLKHNLVAHERIHTGEKPYTCLFCGKSFNQTSSLKSHGKVHSENSPYKCELCETTFTQKRYLTEHQLTHNFSDKPDINSNALKTHTKLHSGKPLNNKCVLFRQKDLHKKEKKRRDNNFSEEKQDEIGEIFGGNKQEDTNVAEETDASKNKDTNEKHNANKIKDGTEKPNAAQKKYVASTITAQNDNVAIAIAVVAGNTDAARTINAAETGTAQTDNIVENAVVAGIADAGKKKYSASTITAQIDNVAIAIAVVAEHAGNTGTDKNKRVAKNKQKICYEKTSGHMENLQASTEKISKMISTDEIRLPCSFCEKVFGNSRSMQEHVKTHTLDHNCSVCGKTFTQLRSLKIHQATHTEASPYKCLICNKILSSQQSLKTHGRIHTGEKPYKCAYCEKVYRHSSSLKNHGKTHQYFAPTTSVVK